MYHLFFKSVQILIYIDGRISVQHPVIGRQLPVKNVHIFALINEEAKDVENEGFRLGAVLVYWLLSQKR